MFPFVLLFLRYEVGKEAYWQKKSAVLAALSHIQNSKLPSQQKRWGQNKGRLVHETPTGALTLTSTKLEVVATTLVPSLASSGLSFTPLFHLR